MSTFLYAHEDGLHTFESVRELVDAVYGADWKDAIGTQVSRIPVKWHRARDHLTAERTLEAAASSLANEISRAIEDECFQYGEQAVAELDELLGDWFDKFGGDERYWIAVGDEELVTISEGDMMIEGDL